MRSRVSRRSDFAADEVRVIDTSALIRLKVLLPVAEQWPLLIRMSALVEAGLLAFPRQVSAEMRAARHPDAPGVWAAGNRGWSLHPSPRDEFLAEALGAAQLVDPNAEAEPEAADPYIVAMALEIEERLPGVQAIVVTEDRVDRMPAKESIVTACERLGLTFCQTDDFVDWLRQQAI
jgi:hypothetical protein